MPNDQWKWMFEGRQENLQRLIDKWKQAKNNQPQFDVIVAPTGFGKTRLVQELYLWLSAHEDPPQENAPQGYWPNSFLNDFTSNEVNPYYPPKFQHARAIIPWLWWGLSVTEDAFFSPPVLKAESFLEAHTDAIVAKMELDQLSKVKLKELSKILTSLAADWATSGIASPLHQLWKILQGNAQSNSRRYERAIRSPDQAFNQFINNRHDVIFDMIRLILDSSITGAPTIPMILILDDSQFLYSSKNNQPIPVLKFIQRLWLEAKKNNWPLFIIATHWDDEWDRQQALPCRESPGNLAQLLHELGEPLGPNIVHRLDKLSHTDLKPIIEKALPGLTKKQSSALVVNVDGHPRMLRFHIEKALKTPKLFVERDVTKALTSSGQKYLDQYPTDDHQIIKRKIEDLEENVKQALGWSSIQGERFLASISEKIAENIDPAFTETVIQNALKKGESPERLIERLNNTSRFNLGKFRTKPFQIIAQEVFHSESPDEFESVDAAVTATLHEWLLAGRLDQPDTITSDTLSSEERRDALMMAVHRFDPNRHTIEDDTYLKAWGNVLARLVELNASERIWDLALYFAVQFAEGCAEGWSLKDVPFGFQLKVIDTLLTMEHIQPAKFLITVLRNELSSLSENSTNLASRLLYSLILLKSGSIDAMEHRFEDARKTYIISREINQKLVENKRTKTNLKLLASSYFQIGMVDFHLLKFDAAKIQFLEARNTYEEIINEYEHAPECLRSLAVSNERIVQIELLNENYKNAKTEILKVHNIMEKNAAKYEHTPNILCDLLITYIQKGDIELREQNFNDAKKLFLDALNISRKIIDEYERTPQSLRDLALSLLRIGDVEFKLNHLGSARTRFEEAHKQYQNIIDKDKYEQTPENLRGLAISLDLIGNVELELQNFQNARKYFLDAWTIRQKIVDKYKHTPESLRDLSVSFHKLGEVDLGEQNFENARKHFLKALKIRQRIVHQYKHTIRSLTDLSNSYERIGDTYGLEGDFTEARQLYLEALKKLQNVVAQNEESPDTIEQISRVNKKLNFTENING
ncbi:Tetratricopeptide repeat protein [Gimesia panareensis]|uniref:Tetratricopeptide repeat protein n=1 Tax=Gimesia panareensis TaxID=2527978 RepID=A0A518FJF9_9PLAN|nr:tetratricopeptide repeat protein [Gimesia panareensis]QDV16492.1 Tetratricopeptide repeat protein [Gimesia panareensis]